MTGKGYRHRRSIRVRLADQPGSLHYLTGLVSGAGVNIVRLEVVSREEPDVWDDIELIADSERQLDVVVHALEERGMPVIELPADWEIRDWAVDVLHALETFSQTADPRETVDLFATTAVSLANADHAFVLMEPGLPDAGAAETRWRLIKEAARDFDPDTVAWCGESVGARIVTSAMRAARMNARTSDVQDQQKVGAVVGIPVSSRRPAHLVVLGRRPPFLGPELRRLGLFAEVAAAHLFVAEVKATA